MLKKLNTKYTKGSTKDTKEKHRLIGFSNCELIYMSFVSQYYFIHLVHSFHFDVTTILRNLWNIYQTELNHYQSLRQ